jgi:hypothetical protein
MIASMGCPYTCSFCIDSTQPYQALDFDVMRDDLRFLLTKFKKPTIAWHDPNFGIKFEDNLRAISTAAPPKSFRFIAESSLSILTEDHLKVMQENGFGAMLPGMNQYDLITNPNLRIFPAGKVNRSEHVNMLFGIFLIQNQFVLGMDCDEGDEPFELTKRFIDKSPAAFPGFSLLSAFGEAAPLNLEYQREGRVLPFPFHFLNNHLAMNLKPKNYQWVDFYDKVIDLTAYSFSPRAIYRRFSATPYYTSKWMNLMRAVSQEGHGREMYYRSIRKNLVEDKQFRSYFEGETTVLPKFYMDMIKKDLGDVV